MRHYVFSAGKEGQKDVIEVAIETAKSLENSFELEHDCVMCAYHSDIEIVDDGSNVYIVMSNDNKCQLIDDCMIFAVWFHQNKERSGIKPKWMKK